MIFLIFFIFFEAILSAFWAPSLNIWSINFSSLSSLFISSEIGEIVSIIKFANLSLKGVAVKTMEETTAAIKQSCEDQKKGITTFIEVILNQELGEPFRRDAMKKPVEVAGIEKGDMKPQKSLVG